eukprot:TRINITY_DN6411_c0_g1_i1.p1 TRINITY_DN6411_c0_g1~~TRINITY_DN6411_c0_g1_i1.p1  ORF type:complete len:294 (-),score=83.67 TRINITY_DN6411_c0_g1_i1:84-965(-)
MLSLAKYSELQELDSVILDTFLPTGKRSTSLVYGRIVSNPFTKSKIPTFPGYNQTVQEVPPGNGNGAHIHKNTEIFLFLDGKWEIGYGFDASEKEVLAEGDLIVVPAYECRTYTNIGSTPGHILTILTGESWVQFDQKVVKEARKFGAICDDWGTLTHDQKGNPIQNLNADHNKDFRRKEDFVVTPPEEMGKNTFRHNAENGKVKMPFIPEGIHMEMVTVSQGCSTRISLGACYTSVVVVKGRGLLQGIQVLDTWDTALVEKVEGISEPEIRLEGLEQGCNTFLVVSSHGTEF